MKFITNLVFLLLYIIKIYFSFREKETKTKYLYITEVKICTQPNKIFFNKVTISFLDFKIIGRI